MKTTLYILLIIFIASCSNDDTVTAQEQFTNVLPESIIGEYAKTNRSLLTEAGTVSITADSIKINTESLQVAEAISNNYNYVTDCNWRILIGRYEYVFTHDREFVLLSVIDRETLENRRIGTYFREVTEVEPVIITK